MGRHSGTDQERKRRRAARRRTRPHEIWDPIRAQWAPPPAEPDPRRATQ
jgi:hypothetical protein